MPTGPIMLAPPLDYFILHEAKPTGPNLGLYADACIAATVVDMFGRKYVYAGVAPRRWNGQFDVDALRQGEFILMPGLVYRMEHVRTSWLASLFRGRRGGTWPTARSSNERRSLQETPRGGP